jgi:hypothetical protein
MDILDYNGYYFRNLLLQFCNSLVILLTTPESAALKSMYGKHKEVIGVNLKLTLSSHILKTPQIGMVIFTASGDFIKGLILA